MSSKVYFVAFIHLSLLYSVTVQQGNLCGVAQPDPAKTCVSIRLPWNPDPIYFCEDKDKFRFRNQCQTKFSSICSSNSQRTDTLMVASPWDCCPLVSYPDSCMNTQCPPPPHGRTCQTTEPSANQNPLDCCNSYFCEENMTPETCHLKRLEQTCNQPPQGKTNCIAFIDPFGCCPKYQCDGDAKAGQCPMESEAIHIMLKFNNTMNNFMPPGAEPEHLEKPAGATVSRVPDEPSPVIHQGIKMAQMQMGGGGGGFGGGAGRGGGGYNFNVGGGGASIGMGGGGGGANIGMGGGGYNFNIGGGGPNVGIGGGGRGGYGRGGGGGGFGGGNIQGGNRNGVVGNGNGNGVTGNFIMLPRANQIQCVGDFNCPGSMKCCSNDMNVYIKDGQSFLFRNRNPTYGYCVEPQSSGLTATKSLKYTNANNHHNHHHNHHDDGASTAMPPPLPHTTTESSM